jgi:hypothetical protein
LVHISNEHLQLLIAQAKAREAQAETALRLCSDFHVFVSYSWQNEDVARQVTDALDGRRIDYVQDRKDVQWGDRINDFAGDAIKRCTDYLLILTKASAASTWCHVEFGVAVGCEKRILTFIADPQVDIPPFAAGHAALRELRDVMSFFSKARIDEGAVDRFIEELLRVRLDELAAFIPRTTGERSAWDAPDRIAREQESWSPIEVFEGLNHDEPARLLGIELNVEQHTLALEERKRGYRPQRYEFAYAPVLTAVRVTPKKEAAQSIGVLEDTGADEPRLRPGASSVEQKLRGKAVYGWHAHQDFWDHSLRRLGALLPRG